MSADAPTPRLVYCHCKYAKVLPPETKAQVLEELVASGVAFEAVADLCEMSARRDPALGRLSQAAGAGGLRIAACYPRAIEWLFHAAGHPLPKAGTEVVNLRTLAGDVAGACLLGRQPIPEPEPLAESPSEESAP